MSHIKTTQPKVSRPLPAVPTKKTPATVVKSSTPLPRAQAHQAIPHGPQLTARPTQKAHRPLPTPPGKKVARPLPTLPGKKEAPNQKLLSYLLPQEPIDTKICHISSIDFESLFNCLLYAATGHGSVYVKDLRNVCKAWSRVIMIPQKNKELQQYTQSYFIDLTQYTKEEAKAKIDADLKNRKVIRHLHIHGQTSEPNIHHASYPDHFFPEKFLGNPPLETLALSGCDVDISSLVSHDDIFFDTDIFYGGIQNTRTLPGFQLIRNLKKLDIFSVTGGSRQDDFFLSTVIPNLTQLEELYIGHRKLTKCVFVSRNLLNLKTITRYELTDKESDQNGFGIPVLDKVYTYTKKEGLWTMEYGALDYESQVDLNYLNKSDNL